MNKYLPCIVNVASDFPRLPDAPVYSICPSWGHNVSSHRPIQSLPYGGRAQSCSHCPTEFLKIWGDFSQSLSSLLRHSSWDGGPLLMLWAIDAAELFQVGEGIVKGIVGSSRWLGDTASSFWAPPDRVRDCQGSCCPTEVLWVRTFWEF